MEVHVLISHTDINLITLPDGEVDISVMHTHVGDIIIHLLVIEKNQIIILINYIAILLILSRVLSCSGDFLQPLQMMKCMPVLTHMLLPTECQNPFFLIVSSHYIINISFLNWSHRDPRESHGKHPIFTVWTVVLL